MAELNRRNSDSGGIDPTEVKILELIELTQDSKDKAFLLILLKLNGNLSNNTYVVTEVAAKLDRHLTIFEVHAEEEAIRLSHSEGIRKTISYISGFVQTVLIALVIYFNTQLIQLNHKDNEFDIAITRNTAVIANHDKVIEQLRIELERKTNVK